MIRNIYIINELQDNIPDNSEALKSSIVTTKIIKEVLFVIVRCEEFGESIPWRSSGWGLGVDSESDLLEFWNELTCFVSGSNTLEC